MEAKEEITQLVDELVAKGGPTTGQIKANQDPVKVARLIELGWKPAEKKLKKILVPDETAKWVILDERLKKIEETLADHSEKIRICSIQR